MRKLNNKIKVLLLVSGILSVIGFYSIPSWILNGSYKHEREKVLDGRRGTCYPINIIGTSKSTLYEFKIKSGDFLYIDCDLKFKFITKSKALNFLVGAFDFDINSDQYHFNFGNYILV